VRDAASGLDEDGSSSVANEVGGKEIHWRQNWQSLLEDWVGRKLMRRTRGGIKDDYWEQ
jgi:hypothetical protein